MFKKLFGWIGRGKSADNPPLEVGGIFGKMTPEGLCGINPEEMNPSEIRDRLAMLYQRHNQAAGSLDAELREEAEHMLQAIVICRQKYAEKPQAEDNR